MNPELINAILAETDPENQDKVRQLLRTVRKEYEGDLFGKIASLAGLMAHNFNGHLTPVIGYAELLQMIDADNLTEDQHEKIRKILEGARGAADAVTSVQYLTNSYSPPEVFDAVPLLNVGITNLNGREIFPETNFPDQPFLISFQKSGLVEVVEQLGRNAYESLEGHEGQVKISATPTVDPRLGVDPADYRSTNSHLPKGTYLHIQVSDTGVGMEPDFIEESLRPFITTKKDTGRWRELGLTTMDRILRDNDCSYDISSKLGEGTTVNCYIPQAKSIEKSETKDKTGLYTILVVEDDQTIQYMMQQLLETKGYTVLTANNGREGLEVYKANKDKIGLTISDMIMPEMGGKEFLTELRKLDPSAAFFIMTGHSGEKSSEGILGDALNYFTKPIPTADLYKAVHNVIGTPEKTK
tara:strand:+ start:13059 stop:14297 length:1239 start_codon:yes stop_codon:yes gene_type:complete